MVHDITKCHLLVDCPLQILGRSFIQQFAGVHTAANLKDQAVRVNMTATTVTSKLNRNEQIVSSDTDDGDIANFVCDCDLIRMFRLTRIKHAQDFSDTFLLEVFLCNVFPSPQVMSCFWAIW